MAPVRVGEDPDAGGVPSGPLGNVTFGVVMQFLHFQDDLIGDIRHLLDSGQGAALLAVIGEVESAL